MWSPRLCEAQWHKKNETNALTKVLIIVFVVILEYQETFKLAYVSIDVGEKVIEAIGMSNDFDMDVLESGISLLEERWRGNLCCVT